MKATILFGSFLQVASDVIHNTGESHENTHNMEFSLVSFSVGNDDNSENQIS